MGIGESNLAAYTYIYRIPNHDQVGFIPGM